MRLRRIAAALLAVGLATAGLTACSAPDSGSQTITVWDPGLLTRTNDNGSVKQDQSFLHQMAAKYEKKHKNIKIKIVELSGDITKDAAQFQAASIAKNGPDIRVSFTGGNTVDYSDFLLDLDGTFSAATVKDLSGWNTVRKGYSSKGALLGLPYGGGSYFYVFYNKKMTTAAGLNLTKPPATWEDLLADGRQVKERTSYTPFWVANQEGYMGAWAVAALVGGQLGGTAFTDMYTGKRSIDDSAMVKAYTAYAELYKDGLTNPDAASVSNSDGLQGFVQGKGAFYISGSWENSGMYDALGNDVGVFQIPMLKGAKYPRTAAGGPNVALSITKYSKHQDAAKDFLRYLAEPTSIDQYVKLFQTEASNSAKADTSVITNPYLKSEAEQLAQTKNIVYPFDNVMPQTTIDLFYKLNATVFTGQTSPKEAVTQLAAQFKTVKK